MLPTNPAPETGQECNRLSEAVAGWIKESAEVDRLTQELRLAKQNLLTADNEIRKLCGYPIDPINFLAVV